MHTWNLTSRLSAVLLLAGTILAVSSPAQVAISGKINGFVTDVSGAGVAGASLNVSGPALMAERSSKSQGDGSFLFDQLPVGTYEVKVSMPGFKTLVQPNVTLTSGFTATSI